MHHYNKITKHKLQHTHIRNYVPLQQDNQTQLQHIHIHNYAPLQQDNQTQTRTQTYS